MATQKRINVAITSDLHKEMKIAAAKKDMTLTQYVTHAIQEMLKKDNEGDNK